MKFRTWKEVRLEILAYTLIPIVLGGLSGIPIRGWHAIWHFTRENLNWFLITLCWLFTIGMVCLFADGASAAIRKRKRIIGSVVVTIWMWAAMFYAAFSIPQTPNFQRHIDPPARWWKCGNS